MLTGQTEIKPGKVLTYRDPPLEAVPDPICWLCGGKTEGLGLPKKKRILDTFTDHALAGGLERGPGRQADQGLAVSAGQVRGCG